MDWVLEGKTYHSTRWNQFRMVGTRRQPPGSWIGWQMDRGPVSLDGWVESAVLLDNSSLQTILKKRPKKEVLSTILDHSEEHGSNGHECVG